MESGEILLIGNCKVGQKYHEVTDRPKVKPATIREIADCSKPENIHIYSQRGDQCFNRLQEVYGAL